MNNNIKYFLLFLLFFAIGMIIAVVVKPQNEFHGPNALSESQKIYYDSKNNKCIKFGIEQILCPKPKKKYHKIIDFFK